MISDYELKRLYMEMLDFDLSPSYTPPVQKVEKYTIGVLVIYDVGFGNTLTIRGNRLPLSWHRGKECKNVGPNAWAYYMEFNYPQTVEFKVLINDSTWETGYNHSVETGNIIVIKPSF